MRAAEEPEATAEREAGDPNRRAGPAGDRDAIADRLGVDLTQNGARADRHRAFGQRDGAHRRDVDQDPARRGAAGEAVTAAQRCRSQRVATDEGDRLRHVVGGRTPHDRLRRHVVEPCVERLGQQIRSGRTAGDNVAVDCPLKLGQGRSHVQAMMAEHCSPRGTLPVISASLINLGSKPAAGGPTRPRQTDVAHFPEVEGLGDGRPQANGSHKLGHDVFAYVGPLRIWEPEAEPVPGSTSRATPGYS